MSSFLLLVSLFCDSMLRSRPREPPPQEVPNVTLTNRPALPTGRLFHIRRSSTIVDLFALQITNFNILPAVDRFFQYAQLFTNYGRFLLKSFMNNEENVLKEQLADQVQMGIWNPHGVNMEDIEERYGKMVYYDEEGMQNHPHILREWAVVSTATAISPLMTIDGILSELPLAVAEDYCRVAPLDDEAALLWGYQMATGLNYCHDFCGIVHGDIRPRNIFVFNNGQHIKLGNFYYHSPVRLGYGERSREQLLYSAPELLPEVTPNNPPQVSPVSRYGYSSDIYSMGMTLYSISHRRTPFEKVEQPEIHLKQLIESGRRPPLRQEIARSLKTTIESCWRTEKRDSSGGIVPLEPRRPTAKAILNYLDYN